jgi:hypothetical protein
MTVTETKKNNNNKIWIGLGAAALFCLCAVACAVVIFIRMGQQVQQGMKADPQAAAEAAHAIADYELPAGYQEEFSMKILTTSMVFMSARDSGSYSLEPSIMLAQFKTLGNEEQIKQQMRQSFERQMGRRNVVMQLVETKKMTIRGEETEVAYYEGTDANSTALRQVVTTFPGKGGIAMLMITGPSEYWDEETINAFIESIH